MMISEADITAALAVVCGICQAQPNSPCINICGGELPGRTVHFFRIAVIEDHSEVKPTRSRKKNPTRKELHTK